MLADILIKVASFENEDQHIYRPRPSNAGPERCIRQMVYQAMGERQDKKIGDRFIHIMNDSSWHEELTADWIRKSAFQIHSQQMAVDITELPFMPEGVKYHCRFCDKEIPTNVLHGHVDAIVTDMLANDYLLEHKAINTFSYERYWNEYPMDYLTQTCLYLHGLNKVQPDMTKAILLIKNKNTSQFMEFVLEYLPTTDVCRILEMSRSDGKRKSEGLLVIEDVVKNAIEKFRYVDECRKTGELPDRPFEFGTNFPCSYCSHETSCWADYESELSAMQTDIDLESEVADMCAFYLQLGYDIKAMTEQKDEIKSKIKSVLKAKNIRQGKAGGFAVNWRIQHSTRLMKREDISPSILPMVTHQTTTEVLDIRKIKEQK